MISSNSTFSRDSSQISLTPAIISGFLQDIVNFRHNPLANSKKILVKL
jgi:hypothetical protein